MEPPTKKRHKINDFFVPQNRSRDKPLVQQLTSSSDENLSTTVPCIETEPVPDPQQHDVSLNNVCHPFSDARSTEMLENVFDVSSVGKIHHFPTCVKTGCMGLTSQEKMFQSTLKERFDHKWIMDKSLSYCPSTGIWMFAFLETSSSVKGGIFCVLCRKHNTKNLRNKSSVFAEDPSTRYRRATLLDHLKTDKHIGAKNAELLNRVSYFQQEITHKENVNNEVLFQVFSAYYYNAQELIANRKVFTLLNLLEHIGLADLKYFVHRSEESSASIYQTLGSVVESKLISKLKAGKACGLLIDDMSDVSTLEQMLCYVQYVDPNTIPTEVKTQFLFISNILQDAESANAETLCNVLVKKLTDIGLDVGKVIGLTTDGAAVMVGKKDGLATRLKRLNPSLFSVHCICHRLALACTDSNVELKVISNVELLLLNLWKLFHYSPKKMACYVKTTQEYRQINMDPQKTAAVSKVMKKACKTRWLSFEASIQAVYEEFIPVTQTLNKLENDPTAIGLLKKMNCITFIGYMYILHSVLPILATVSKLFQKGYINFASVGPTLDMAKDKLSYLNESFEPVTRLLADIKTDGRLGLLEMTINDQQKTHIQNTLQKYSTALQENIDKRFPNIPVFTALSVFDPTLLPEKASPEFRLYGSNSINLIHKQFFTPVGCDLEELSCEWNLLKYRMLSWRNELSIDTAVTPTEQCLHRIMDRKLEFNQMCPNLTRLAEMVLCIPVSNAWPERGASKVKLVKTNMRNRLSNVMLQNLLQIAINGPKGCTDEADNIITEAVTQWQTAKSRRRLPVKKKGHNQPSRPVSVISMETQTDSMPPVVLPDEANSQQLTSDNVPDENQDKDESAEMEKALLQLKMARNIQEAQSMYLKSVSTTGDYDSDSDSDWVF